ncbi:hypothetical protein C8T65DRAFT_740166 [Cerioporus squamosus]|nr:hypothetical protein C8T65DRAFT_740166 [Cerioporus squamosus]
MDADYHCLEFPLLLAPPLRIPADSVSDESAHNKYYRFLVDCYYEYPATQRARVSDLQDAVLKQVHDIPEYRNRSDSDFVINIHECIRLPLPSAPTYNSKKEACEVIDVDWLSRNASPVISSRLPIANLKTDCLVAVLTIIASSRSLPLSIVQEVNASPGQIRREQIAAAAQKRDSPSTGATLSQRLKTQTAACIDAVHNGRPIELTGAPITIYHPAFANFLKYMEEPRVFTPEELDVAQDFITQAAAYHKHASRRHKLSPSMSAGVHQFVLELTPISNSTGTFTTDGAMFASRETPDGFCPLIGAHELRPEIGEGGCDPSAQAENVYVAYYSSDEARPIREQCCCPAVLIGSTGPNLQVSGAVFADQFIVQNLGDSVSVVPRLNRKGRSLLDDAGYRVAQLFYALRMCLRELDDYYADLIDSVTIPKSHPGAVGVMPGRPIRPFIRAARGLQPPPMVSPHFKTYKDQQGKAVVLTYKKRLEMEFPGKAVFVAEAKTETETVDVVVKFAPAYCQAAHELLASASPPQAPKLRHCKFVESVGTWVVVMDYVKGREVNGVLEDPAHIASLENAVTTLHAKGFVFGDLRKRNVFVVENTVVLIDFDWCGEEGTARYPSDIVLQKGVWHPAVGRGELLKKMHDRYHFHALTGRTLPPM